MAKRKFTQQDIESALDINSSDSEYEDDVEYDVMYDSENDEDYIAACSSSSDEDDEFDAIASTSTRRGRLPSQRMRTSTPSPVSSSAPSTSDSTSAPAAPPDVRMQRRRRVRSEEYIPSIVDFNVSTLKTRSDFRWHCRPQSTTSTRVSARNIMFDITPGPAQQARTADNPEKSFRLLFEDKIISEIVEWTNQKIQIESQKYSHQSTTISQTSAAEPAPTRDGNKPVMGECTSSRKRCELCKPCNDKKTRYSCHKCDKAVCLGHIFPFLCELCQNSRQTVLLGPRRMCCLTMKPLNLYLRLCKTPSL
ncbi:hypothetical protein Avbf_10582 [Armadillidium vulgare]|nr:hypothetical protein Avbf_10582 [Armadillidium vulgare]